jgi:LCP family protein required for cell wall assembly
VGFAVLSFGIVGIIVVYYWQWQTLYYTKGIDRPAVAGVENKEKNGEEPESPLPEEKGRLNILVLGIDTPGGVPGRSDSILLITANRDSHLASVISIPRDTRVDLPGVGLTKITHANIVGEAKGGVHEGAAESVNAVRSLLGVTIDYYIEVSFKGFENVIDALGGVDVNLPKAVNDSSFNLHLAAGEHHLSGEEALQLAQARYDLPEGDFDRQQNQFYILQGLANQLLNPSTISELPELLTVIRQGLVDTNLPISEMLKVGLEFKGIDKEAIKYYQLPGQGISAPDPLVGSTVYYYEPNEEGVEKVLEEAFAR